MHTGPTESCIMAQALEASVSLGVGGPASLNRDNLKCPALPHRDGPAPPVEGGRPRSGDGTLLCPAQLPGALDPVAAHALIGINQLCLHGEPSLEKTRPL